MSLRVLLADDQELVRVGFRMILEAQPDITVVGEAADGAQAIDQARTIRPDVVLMDVRMPGTDGLQATRALAGPDVTDPVKVLILTTFDLDDHVYEALRAGASGFLLKDAPRADLIAAVRTIAAGDALLAPSITRRLIAEYARLDRAQRELGAVPMGRRAVATEELTAREVDVLTLLARGMSNAEIAAALVVSEHTVKTHVAHILAKLGLRDRVQAVVWAYETGLAQPSG